MLVFFQNHLGFSENFSVNSQKWGPICRYSKWLADVVAHPAHVVCNYITSTGLAIAVRAYHGVVGLFLIVGDPCIPKSWNPRLLNRARNLLDSDWLRGQMRLSGWLS